MGGTSETTASVRPSLFETKRLVWALVLSFLLHGAGWGGYALAKKYGLWQRWHWLAKKPLAARVPPPARAQKQEESLIFLEVDPDQVAPEPPQNTKYYSSKNSRAANPEADRDLNQAKLAGRQTDVPKTRDTPRQPNTQPQPTPATPPPKQAAQPEPATPAEPPGEMTLAKPQPKPQKNKTQEKPRTLKEALAQSNLRPSMALQQEGGVRRQSLVPSLDAKATPFGEYDRRFIDAVTDRWYSLLDSQKFAQDRSGKVTLRFRLNYDGSITDMTVLQNTVGDLLAYVCRNAVTDPAPFEAWPSDMRRMIGANFREITFTFYYY